MRLRCSTLLKVFLALFLPFWLIAVVISALLMIDAGNRFQDDVPWEESASFREYVSQLTDTTLGYAASSLRIAELKDEQAELARAFAVISEASGGSGAVLFGDNGIVYRDEDMVPLNLIHGDYTVDADGYLYEDGIYLDYYQGRVDSDDAGRPVYPGLDSIPRYDGRYPDDTGEWTETYPADAAATTSVEYAAESLTSQTEVTSVPATETEVTQLPEETADEQDDPAAEPTGELNDGLTADDVTITSQMRPRAVRQLQSEISFIERSIANYQSVYINSLPGSTFILGLGEDTTLQPLAADTFDNYPGATQGTQRISSNYAVDEQGILYTWPNALVQRTYFPYQADLSTGEVKDRRGTLVLTVEGFDERVDGEAWVVFNPTGQPYASILYQLRRGFYNQFASSPYLPPLLLGAALILGIVLLVWLINAAGYKRKADGSLPGRGEITLNWIDGIPQELFIPGLILATVLVGGIGLRLTESPGHVSYQQSRLAPYYGDGLMVPLGLGVIWGALVLLAIFILSEVRRVKAGTFWRSFLIARIGRWAGRRIKPWTERRKWLAALVFYYTLLIIAGSAALYGYVAWPTGFSSLMVLVIALICLLLPLVFGAAWLRNERDLDTLKDTTGRMVAGELDAVVERPLQNKNAIQMAEDLEHLGEGAEEAIKERLRSERIKADLITNVSHDLKTPLTAIISYIDLLQKDGLDSEQAPGYVEQLALKTERLRQLTENLVDASKASSGAVKLDMQPLNLVELLRQVAGEFTPRLANEQLELVTRLPEGIESVLMMTDGSLLWRVLENLLDNARKYSLAGSRVYLYLELGKEEVRIRVRNITAEPLNISEEELMERFVRNDESRHSAGSGLGLSIARSLTEILSGEFSINITDDVFVATVAFPGDHILSIS